MHRIINHFTDDDLYKFTMCCAVIDNFPRAQVVYEFTDRNNTCYPAGFAEALMEQVTMLESVVITHEEIEFMKRRCPYLPYWFYDYLKGFRFKSSRVRASQDRFGHLSVKIEGSWCETILFEVKILAIISELYYMTTGLDRNFDTAACAAAGAEKARRLIEAGCHYSDMGTRRRASFAVHAAVVEAMARTARSLDGTPGRFVGSSNVWLSMKNDLCPIGTMAHEFICAIAGMYGPQMANNLAMQAWSKTYRGALGTFLYDTYGWPIFSLNFSEDFANMFKGLRVDSGDNYEQLAKIEAKYRSLGINPLTKQVIFSNALNTDEAIELQHYASQHCIPSFGIGTHFTNDIPGVRPLNIVIKLTAVKITESWSFFNSTCKLSEDPGNIRATRRLCQHSKKFCISTTERKTMEIDFAPEFTGHAGDFEMILVEADVENPPTPDSLWRELNELAAKMRATTAMADINRRPAIAATRAVYKACGKDPNRYRPSAEALSRRVVKGMDLYRTTVLVDLINLVSLWSGHSIGGFDADSIDGHRLTLGIGREGEDFDAIGRGKLNIAGLPVYRDATGGIGTPTSDNERTKLTPSTRRILMTVNLYGRSEFTTDEITARLTGLLRDYASADAVLVRKVKVQRISYSE